MTVSSKTYANNIKRLLGMDCRQIIDIKVKIEKLVKKDK